MTSKIEIPMIEKHLISRNKDEFKQVFVKIHTTRLPTIKENRELKLKGVTTHGNPSVVLGKSFTIRVKIDGDTPNRCPLLRKHCSKFIIVLIFVMLGISIAIFTTLG